VPVLSAIIVEANQQIISNMMSGIVINFVGIGIGDGWVHPILQYKGYIVFSYMNQLIDQFTYDALLDLYSECATLINESNWVEAVVPCDGIAGTILAENPGMSFYDIRLICPDPLSHDCYDFNLATKYMEQDWVRKQINVGNRTWYDREVEMAIDQFADDEMSYEYHIPYVLANGIRVLIYSGEYDFAANYVGREMWTQAMKWSGQQQFSSANFTEWNIGSSVAGYSKSAENFTFLKLKNAGHMVPMNIPKVALRMLQQFLEGTPFS